MTTAVQKEYNLSQARMAKLVDAPASGAGTVKGMEVRVLFRAPKLIKGYFLEYLMNKINFITSNQRKIKSLENSLKANRLDVVVRAQNLDIMEPQFDTVQDVSRFKALKAFDILKEPVLVEDGGLSIEALNGFPGVYTKYILKTLGADGILKLMDGIENRFARFISVATFIHESGEIFQFERDDNGFEISRTKVNIQSPYAWSEFWQIIYLKEYGKTLCELSQEEVSDFYEQTGTTGSIQKFVQWYKTKSIK